MKGYIFIKAKPEKDGCTLKGRVNLNNIRLRDKFHLLRVFLQELEITTDQARTFLDVIDKTNEEDKPNE